MRETWMFLTCAILMTMLITDAKGQSTADEWILEGDRLFNECKYDEAIKALYNATLFLNEDNRGKLERAWFEMGNAFVDHGLNRNATLCYENAISLNSTVSSYWCDYSYSAKLSGNMALWRAASRSCAQREGSVIEE